MASQALTTLVSISIFLAYGTTAAVARQLGPATGAAAIRQGIDGLWLAGAIGVVVLAAGWPLAAGDRPRSSARRPASPQGAVTYLRISLLGAPAMLAVLAGTGVLRGLQDTRTPLAVAVGANLVNIVLNAVLVLGLRLGTSPARPGARWPPRTRRPPPTSPSWPGAPAGPGSPSAPDRAGVRAAAVAGAALVVRTLRCRRCSW